MERALSDVLYRDSRRRLFCLTTARPNNQTTSVPFYRRSAIADVRRVEHYLIASPYSVVAMLPMCYHRTRQPGADIAPNKSRPDRVYRARVQKPKRRPLVDSCHFGHHETPL